MKLPKRAAPGSSLFLFSCSLQSLSISSFLSMFRLFTFNVVCRSALIASSNGTIFRQIAKPKCKQTSSRSEKLKNESYILFTQERPNVLTFMDDLDDFETVKPPPLKRPRASVSKVTSNTVSVSSKWKDSQLLTKIKSQSIEVVIEK